MITIDAKEAGGQLKELIEQVRTGQRIVITLDGRPVADLQAFLEEPVERRAGLYAGRIRMSDDFDDPLSEFDPGE